MQRKKTSQLRMVIFAGFALFVAAVVFAVSCKMLGDTGSEDEKREYLPTAIPLKSLTVKNSEGNNLLIDFQQDRQEYMILFDKEQIGEEVVIRGVAASDKAEVMVMIGETIAQKNQLTTTVPDSSLRVDILVTEETGQFSTRYEVLLQQYETLVSLEIEGTVTINGSFDQNGLTAVISSTSGILDSNATFTWYRNGVVVNSVTGAAGKTYAITAADNGAVIKVEVTVEGKDGMLTATRRAPQWESYDAIAALINQVKALIEQNIKSTVVGDPAENSHSYASVLDLIETLNILMEGIEQTRETTGSDGIIRPESVKVYDYAQIADKTAELEALLTGSFSHISEETIIVRKLVFGYAGAVEQTVKLMSKKGAVYEIELIGASGGHVATNGTPPTFDAGGKGGYVIAQYNLAAGLEYTLRVGGAGSSTAHYNSATETWTRPEFKLPAYIASRAGGWPNGGAGGAAVTPSNDLPGGSGGGGSTDIRLKTATGVFDGSSADPRFMVAAGGGGAAQFALKQNGKNVPGKGGNADECGVAAQDNAKLNGNQRPQPGAATDDKGQKGVDGINESANAEGRGGGGGGFKGGEAITSRNYKGNNKVTGSGAGGSNRIKMDSSYVSSSGSSGFIDVFGNGAARIQWIHN